MKKIIFLFIFIVSIIILAFIYTDKNNKKKQNNPKNKIEEKKKDIILTIKIPPLHLPQFDNLCWMVSLLSILIEISDLEIELKNLHDKNDLIRSLLFLIEQNNLPLEQRVHSEKIKDKLRNIKNYYIKNSVEYNLKYKDKEFHDSKDFFIFLMQKFITYSDNLKMLFFPNINGICCMCEKQIFKKKYVENSFYNVICDRNDYDMIKRNCDNEKCDWKDITIYVDKYYNKNLPKIFIFTIFGYNKIHQYLYDFNIITKEQEQEESNILYIDIPFDKPELKKKESYYLFGILRYVNHNHFISYVKRDNLWYEIDSFQKNKPEISEDDIKKIIKNENNYEGNTNIFYFYHKTNN